MCNANKQGKRGNTMNRKMAIEILKSITKEKLMEGAGILVFIMNVAKYNCENFDKMNTDQRNSLIAAFLIEYGRKSVKENETQ